MDLPVDAANYCIEGKGRVMGPVLAPDCAAEVLAFVRPFKGVVDCGDDNKKPGNGRQDTPY